MSSVAAAARLVARARRRLTAFQFLGGAAFGAFVGALVAALDALLGQVGLLEAAGPRILVLAPLAGALGGGISFVRRAPGSDAAAWALDRAAGTGEAFLAALTARDAPPAMRELAASRGLSLVRDRRLGALLPLRAPRWAVPAVLGLGLAAALSLVAPAPPAGARPTAASPAVTLPGAAGASAGSPGGAERALGGLPESELRSLAEQLAAGGSPAAHRALRRLAEGDREGALAALRDALADDTGAEPGGAAGGTALTAPGPSAGDAGPVWASGRWPLRYDRTVRRWFERGARSDGATNGAGDSE